MNNRDQENIYNIYTEKFRNMDLTQDGDLNYLQHPNSHLSTGIWRGLSDPTRSKQTYTPRQENEECATSGFNYKLKSTGEIFAFDRTEGDNIILHGPDNKKVKLPLYKLKSLFVRV